MPVIPSVALYSPPHSYQPPTSAMVAAAHLREAVRAKVEYEELKARALTDARVRYEQARAFLQ
eukprot:2939515-Pleurochrysis_carterae.AAC.1